MRPKIFRYVGSKCQHFNPAIDMRCLFGLTQYRYLVHTGTSVLENIYISTYKKIAQVTFFLTLKHILLLPLKLHILFGELSLYI